MPTTPGTAHSARAPCGRRKARDVAVIHTVSAVFAGLFALLNLFSIRRSIMSLAFPRRLGNVEFGEAVPTRYLDRVVMAFSVGCIAAVMSLMVPAMGAARARQVVTTVRRKRPFFPGRPELLRRLASARECRLHVDAGAPRQRFRSRHRAVRPDAQPEMGARSVSSVGACASSPVCARSSVPPRDGVELSTGRLSPADSRHRRQRNVLLRRSSVADSGVSVPVCSCRRRRGARRW